MKRVVKFGLVGAGRIAQTYAGALARSRTARLVGVADVRLSAARDLAREHDCGFWGSAAAMADGAGLDAAIVCTPPATHHDIATDLLERGIHVLSEKPLTTDLASARDLEAVAKTRGLHLAMATKFRLVPEVRWTWDLLRAGVLGDAQHIQVTFASPVDMRDRWNSDPRLSGGGVLMDNGPHALDLVRFLGGPIDEIQAAEGPRSQGLSVEETVWLWCRTRNGVTATVELSWSLDRGDPLYLAVHASQGLAKVGWREASYRSQKQGDEPVGYGGSYDKLAAFRGQVENFAAAVTGQGGLVATVADGVATVAAVAAAYASMESGTRVRIPGPQRGEPAERTPANRRETIQEAGR